MSKSRLTVLAIALLASLQPALAQSVAERPAGRQTSTESVRSAAAPVQPPAVFALPKTATPPDQTAKLSRDHMQAMKDVFKKCLDLKSQGG